MKKGLALIKPLLKPEETESNGIIVMCTVKGDLHDIGKNLVVMMLEGAGYDVIDLGVDLSIEKLIQQIKEIKPDILLQAESRLAAITAEANRYAEAN